MSELDGRLDRILQARKDKGRFRSLKEYDVSSQSALIDFSSNDYLSLTSSPSLRQNYIHRLQTTSQILGSTGSRLLSGSSQAHTSLENRFAKHFVSPSALLFNSGWDANVSFFSTIPQPQDWVVYDELVHASVHSGMRASRVDTSRRKVFDHNDPEGLRVVLRDITSRGSSKGPQPVVYLALESLYSMDGDFSPLPKLLDILDEYVPRSRQCVVMDEAHSTGVYGLQGRGIGHALGEVGGSDLDVRVGVRLMTFGKAVGGSGAVLLCSPMIRTFLINFARPLIFSTALPHSTLVALECAWDILQSSEGDERRQNLYQLAADLHDLLTPLLGYTPNHILKLPLPSPTPFPPSLRSTLPPNPPSPIHALLSSKPHALSAFLLSRGYIVRPVVPPTVPPGGERIRICLRADMRRKDLEGLVSALAEWVRMETRSSVGGSSISGELSARSRAKL